VAGGIISRYFKIIVQVALSLLAFVNAFNKAVGRRAAKRQTNNSATYVNLYMQAEIIVMPRRNHMTQQVVKQDKNYWKSHIIPI
jgi:hypothetical protein